MVTVEHINENKENLKELFDEYNGIIDELQQYWIGKSHDSLVNKATEFSSEFSKTLDAQFENYAKIVNEYAQSVQKIDLNVDGTNLFDVTSSDDYISINRVKSINEKIDSITDVKLDASAQNYNV